MEDKVDIFHPFAQLSWKECSPIPNAIHNADIVTIGDKVFVSMGKQLPPSRHNAKLFVSTTSFKSWKEVPTPSSSYTLAEYQSQLVLIGGHEVPTREVTNKVWTSENGEKWLMSLPPMMTPRHSSTAMGTESCLIVAAGNGEAKKSRVDSIELFNGTDWFFVPQLPEQMSNVIITLHGNYLYLAGRHKHTRIVYRCHMDTLVKLASGNVAHKTKRSSLGPAPTLLHSSPQKHKRPSVGSNPLWTKFHNSLQESFISFDQHLISIGGFNECKHSFSSKVQAFSEHTQSWAHVGNAPDELFSSVVTALPTGELAVIGGLHTLSTGDAEFHKSHIKKSSRVFKGSFCGVSPFDPDATFTVSALCRLEEAGLSIAKPLMGTSSQLLKLLHAPSKSKQLVTNCKKKQDRLKFLNEIGRLWHAEESGLDPVWNIFLGILKFLRLEELSKKIEDYLYGGFKYMDAYHHIIANQECLELLFAKIIFLGLPDLGKTSLRRRLLGEIEDLSSAGEEDQGVSTGTVESGHSVFIKNISSAVALISKSNWSVTSDLAQEAQVFLRFVYEHITCGSLENSDQLESNPKPKNGVKRWRSLSSVADISRVIRPRNHRQTVRSNSRNSPPLVADMQDSPSPTPRRVASSDALDRIGPSSIPEMVALFSGAIGPSFWKSMKQHLQAFLRIEDTGGQPELMDMLPALTIGPGLYLLFCKMTDDLQSHYNISFRSQSGESTVPVQSTHTVEEHLLSALSSISCMSSYSTRSRNDDHPSSKFEKIFQNSSKSVAFVVGTHKDRATSEQVEKLDQDLQKSLKSTYFYEKGLVQFHSPDKLIIPIDNMNGGKSEIDYLRKLIQETLEHHFKKLALPAPWFAFSLCLRSKPKRTTSLKSCIEVGQKLGMKEYETRVALWFLHHHAGILMHFPNIPQVSDLVITDPQVMYDSVTHLILNAFKFGKMSMAAADKFKNTGQFSLEDLAMATASASEDYLSAEHLVAILEHLNIIAVIPGFEDKETTYLMPSVLKNATQVELDECFQSCGQEGISPLLIRFKCGFVPIGVFPALMANLMSQSLYKGKHLCVITEGMKKNKIQLKFGSDRDTVTLMTRLKFFEVLITRDAAARVPAHEVCIEVRDLVESTLNTVTSRMNISFLKSYQLAFECPTHPGRDHLCVVDSNEECIYKMDCLLDQHHPPVMEPCHLVWFEQSPQCGLLSYSKQLSVPSVSTYISTLPVTAYPYLDQELDQDHDGVEEDLNTIASHLLNWEEKLPSAMGLTYINVQDIKEKNKDRPELQRQAVLRQWRNIHGVHATYRNLLELLVAAGHQEGAQSVCSVVSDKV